MDKSYDEWTKRTRRRHERGNTHRTTQKDSKKYIKHGFWFKKFTSILNRLAPEMNRCLQDAQVLDWMTKGKTTLIQKDPNKGTAPNNYRPITCLPVMWKILTAQIRKEIYNSLTSHGLFSEEQKGYRKGSRRTAELLYIDQHILSESKTRRKNLAMAWVDYKKAYDMVPPSWIIKCLKMYKISYEVINFIEKTMTTWRVELTAGGKSLVETKIVWSIFLGDALSPLLLWRQIKIKRSPDEQPFKSVWGLVHLNIAITKRGVYFSHVWRRGGLALDPS